VKASRRPGLACSPASWPSGRWRSGSVKKESPLLDSLSEDVRKRLDKGKEIVAPVEVEPLGNAWRLVAIVVGPVAGPK
ncbi:MAG: hypothetical protein ACREX8_12395, partial [Gammaproteobacteria bacterium]